MAEVREVFSLPISRSLVREVRRKAEDDSIAVKALLIFRILLKENGKTWWGKKEFGTDFIQYETGLTDAELTERKALVGFRVSCGPEPLITTELGVMTSRGPRSILLAELSSENELLCRYWSEGYQEFVTEATGEVFRSEMVAAVRPEVPSQMELLAFASKRSIHLFFVEPGLYWFDPNDGMRFLGRYVNETQRPLVGVRN